MIRSVASALFLASLAFVVACDDDDDPLGLPVTATLTSGTAVSNISGSVNSVKLYRITVPAGSTRLAVATVGGTGNVDLVVGRGATPTQANIECVSDEDDNDESCTEDSPAAGDWYAVLEGGQAYSGVTLVATITRP